jgi:hypothetical protein
MKFIKKMLTMLVFASAMVSAVTVFAAEETSQSSNLPEIGVSPQQQRQISAKASLNRDAVCTKCHDENEVKPVLSIYQTKHGVKGDLRTPSCQSCHGESDAHIKNADVRLPVQHQMSCLGQKVVVIPLLPGLQWISKVQHV